MELTLVRNPKNDRTRGRGQRKADGAAFNFADKFNSETGAFGYKWHETKNKGKPVTLNQVI